MPVPISFPLYDSNPIHVSEPSPLSLNFPFRTWHQLPYHSNPIAFLLADSWEYEVSSEHRRWWIEWKGGEDSWTRTCGERRLQWPHHGAWKSTKRKSTAATAASKLPSSSSTTLPSRGIWNLAGSSPPLAKQAGVTKARTKRGSSRCLSTAIAGISELDSISSGVGSCVEHYDSSPQLVVPTC